MIGVLVSGNGTNLQALLDAELPVVAVASNRRDAAALARLALSGDILLVQADFTLKIADTALAPSASDFDGDSIPIHISLVLRR